MGLIAVDVIIQRMGGTGGNAVGDGGIQTPMAAAHPPIEGVVGLGGVEPVEGRRRRRAGRGQVRRRLHPVGRPVP